MTELQKDGGAASTSLSPESRRSEELPSGEVIRVLLVDDDDNFREAIGAELSDLGFSVTNFSDGDALLGFMNDGNSADVIVLDWQLRATTGLEILPRLRRRGINIPVVFLTGMPSTDHERLALDHGALDFVDKMRGASILARRIRLIVEAHRSLTVTNLPTDEIVRGNLTLRPKVSRALWKNVDVGLTVTEFNIVHPLAMRAGEYMTYRAIYDCVHWSGFVAGSGDDGYRTNVRSSIKRIRGKFAAVDEGFAEIENYPAFGYRWRAEPGSAPAGMDEDSPPS
jgi:two-component system response regulator ChvI